MKESANSPFFSIIIPVYNVAAYLRECLDSVLAQTFSDWEAICVDDGSTDGSGAILDEYAAKDERFRVVHKANGGVSSARNVGIDEARGEWIWFVDSDDSIEVNALERLVKLDSKADIVWFGLNFIYDDGVEKACSCSKVEDAEINESTAQVIASLAKNESGIDFFGYTFDKIVRRSIVRAANIYFDVSISVWEDALFALNYLAHAKTFAILSDVIYRYRWHNGGLTHQKNKNHLPVGVLFRKYGEAIKWQALKRFAIERAAMCFRWELAGERKMDAARQLLSLYRQHANLFEVNGKFKRLVIGLARLPLSIGAPMLAGISNMRRIAGGGGVDNAHVYEGSAEFSDDYWQEAA